VPWHLEIVARLADELCDHYPEADRNLVKLMAWLHDYGKILDYDDQYAVTLTAGRQKLTELGFPPEYIDRAIGNIETLDKKLEVDIHQANIEVQIVSSADGCSHMAGPFMNIFWNEATDKTFAGKEYEALMELNRIKLDKDRQYKIVLPEAQAAFESRYRLLREQAGGLPEHFFS